MDNLKIVMGDVDMKVVVTPRRIDMLSGHVRARIRRLREPRHSG